MVTIDTEGAVLDIEDIGVTLRTLLGYASTGYLTNPKRIWKIRYKNTVIGHVRLKTNRHIVKEYTNDPTN